MNNHHDLLAFSLNRQQFRCCDGISCWNCESYRPEKHRKIPLMIRKLNYSIIPLQDLGIQQVTTWQFLWADVPDNNITSNPRNHPSTPRGRTPKLNPDPRGAINHSIPECYNSNVETNPLNGRRHTKLQHALFIGVPARMRKLSPKNTQTNSAASGHYAPNSGNYAPNLANLPIFKTFQSHCRLSNHKIRPIFHLRIKEVPDVIVIRPSLSRQSTHPTPAEAPFSSVGHDSQDGPRFAE